MERGVSICNKQKTFNVGINNMSEVFIETFGEHDRSVIFLEEGDIHVIKDLFDNFIKSNEDMGVKL